MPTKYRYIALLSLFAFLLLAKVQVASAQYTEYETKASIIYHFGKYITWPSKAFSKDGKIILGILGDDPFGSTIDDILRNRSSKNRSWEIRRANTPSALRGCHIIFIGKSNTDKVKEIIAEITNRNQAFVLTIGDDIDGFCKYGGVINFREGKHYFNVNLDAATNASLTIDAKLLQLAREIVTYDSE